MTRGTGAAPPAVSRLPLTRTACLAFLAAGGHGRVAATMRAVPVIIPVTFTIFGDDVIFSPADDSVSQAVKDSVVAFETDDVGCDGGYLWDVHVTGVARPFAPKSAAPSFRLSSEVMTGWQDVTCRAVRGVARASAG